MTTTTAGGPRDELAVRADDLEVRVAPSGVTAGDDVPPGAEVPVGELDPVRARRVAALRRDRTTARRGRLARLLAADAASSGHAHAVQADARRGGGR